MHPNPPNNHCIEYITCQAFHTATLEGYLVICAIDCPRCTLKGLHEPCCLFTPSSTLTLDMSKSGLFHYLKTGLWATPKNTFIRSDLDALPSYMQLIGLTIYLYNFFHYVVSSPRHKTYGEELYNRARWEKNAAEVPIAIRFSAMDLPFYNRCICIATSNKVGCMAGHSISVNIRMEKIWTVVL
jgi:hypothetical protein